MAGFTPRRSRLPAVVLSIVHAGYGIAAAAPFGIVLRLDGLKVLCRFSYSYVLSVSSRVQVPHLCTVCIAGCTMTNGGVIRYLIFRQFDSSENMQFFSTRRQLREYPS